jgi:hypothetical protein
MQLSTENLNIQSAIQQSLIDKLDPVNRGRFFSVSVGALLTAQGLRNINNMLMVLDSKSVDHGVTRDKILQSACMSQLNLLWLVTEDLSATSFKEGVDIDSYIDSLGDFLLENKDDLFIGFSSTVDMFKLLQTIDMIFSFIKSQVDVQVQESDLLIDIFDDSDSEENGRRSPAV